MKRFFVLLSICFHLTCACVDDNAGIREISEQFGEGDISGCIDLSPGACLMNNKLGQIAKEYCCQTCNEPDDPIENDLPDTDETVQLFLLSGQSEACGAAQVTDLQNDATTYPYLQGEIDGTWFAGYRYSRRPENFFISKMQAGDEKATFGPEISFAERMHSLTGEPTMVMKYCNGGTNVFEDWNPDTPENSWDKDADDGTSQWMLDNAGLKFSSKAHLFKNMVYTIRKTEETLKEGGVSFRWAGIIWVQGVGDRKNPDTRPLWLTFGENTARTWEGFRDAFNPEYVDGTVPIIDNGSSKDNDLHSGKVYATEIVKGCKAINVEKGSGADDETFTDCTVGAGNPCLDSPNTHTNWDFFNFYGYDPQYFDDLKPEGATDKIFHWWANFPYDLHSAYEGMIQNGQMYANHFLLNFLDDTLPSEYAEVDPAIQFPYDRCDDGTLPNAEYICWIDHRDETMMVELCELEEEEEEESIYDNDESSASSFQAQGSIMFLFGAILLSIFG